MGDHYKEIEALCCIQKFIYSDDLNISSVGSRLGGGGGSNGTGEAFAIPEITKRP